MEDKYYLIYPSEDGSAVITEYTKESLLQALEDEDYGNAAEFFDKFERGDSDTAYWEKIMIIKGQIVKPKTKEKVLKYDI